MLALPDLLLLNICIQAQWKTKLTYLQILISDTPQFLSLPFMDLLKAHHTHCKLCDLQAQI